jgi:energy-coupling factor transporter ATP-binding protein EcfA2
LRKFSLFTANPDVEFECGNGVLCLIGANGIGKSTLLSAINFCLTGIVPESGREFRSMEEYYELSLRNSANYFQGRIFENDREEAEIRLWFQVGDYEYIIKRGLFEHEELRELSVVNTNDGVSILSEIDNTRRECHQHYTAQLTQHVGLSTFAEFVFYSTLYLLSMNVGLHSFGIKRFLNEFYILHLALIQIWRRKWILQNVNMNQQTLKYVTNNGDATKTRKRIIELKNKLTYAALKLQNF